MNCPVCKRELAPTLSICLTCGAMMNDSVREELETKVGKLPPPLSVGSFIENVQEPKTPTLGTPLANITRPEAPSIAVTPAKRLKPDTAELKKRDTSPTLVGFQVKNPTVPDWRLELQNSVRKRRGSDAVSESEQLTPTAISTSTKEPDPVDPVVSPPARDERVANALKRIERSRQAYSAGTSALATAFARTPAQPKPTVTNRSFPFNVVERTSASAPAAAEKRAFEPSKPKPVTSLRIEKKKFDTNKLPPIPEPDQELPKEIEPHREPDVVNSRFDKLSIHSEPDNVSNADTALDDYEVFDDLAPLSMRFGAGVFDLIIGGFAAAILLSPFLLSSANLASLPGALAITGAVLVVMFVYQTVTIAFMGRTVGMRLFSIEMIDPEANELPTFHQSAVNSAAYLMGLLLGGIGFLPVLFDEERRAFHERLSGTILVREE